MVELEPAERQRVIEKIGGAALVFAVRVRKMNDHYNWQDRLLVITELRFYNIKKGIFGYSIKRDLDVRCITGIVLRRESNEFLLKITNEDCGDHRYQADCGERLARELQRILSYLKVWKVESDLDDYHRMKRRPARREIEVTEPAKSSRHSTDSRS